MDQPKIKSWKLHDLHKTLLKIMHILKANGQDFKILKVSESSETRCAVLTPMQIWGVQKLTTLKLIVEYRSLGNFRGKKNLCDNFSRVKFSFSGPSTKIYHRENLSCTKTRWTSTEELCVFVAITFIVKSGRQLLDKLASLKNNELLAATP